MGRHFGQINGKLAKAVPGRLGWRQRDYRLVMRMLPLKVVSSRTALPSPYVPVSRRFRPRSLVVPRVVIGISDRTSPENDEASTSKPLPGAMATRTSPEWDLSE